MLRAFDSALRPTAGLRALAARALHDKAASLLGDRQVQAARDTAREALRRFPGVPVVVDHMGYPDITGDTANLLRLARLPNAYVKVTEFYNHSKTKEYPYADVLPTVRRVYDAFGPRRLMWGTGFVHGERVGRIPYGQELELIQEHVPFFTPADQEWILGRTALTLWRFPAATGA